MESETVLEEQPPAEPVVMPVERGAKLPLMLTLSGLVIWFGFQTLHLAFERSNLNAVRTSQEAAIEESQKLRAQFESLINKTTELANKGHAGAKMVLDELQKRAMPAAKPEAKATK
jgi:hypothetical protein